MGGINQDTGVVTYTPNQGYVGNDIFTFNVNDGKTDSRNIGTVNIGVNGGGGIPPPTAINQSIKTSQNTPVNITLEGSDPQNPNATLTAHIVSAPSHGTLGGINQDTGVVTYTPNQGYVGNDIFTFNVNDGKTDSRNIGTVNLKVGPALTSAAVPIIGKLFGNATSAGNATN